MKYFVPLILALLFFGSCGKENDYTTYEPKPYLPAYPGSYWQYSDGSIIETGNNYERAEIFKHIFNGNQTECESIETANFPIYDNAYLKEYTMYKNLAGGGCFNKILLSENLGDEFLTSTSSANSVLRVVAVDTTIVLPNGKTYNQVIQTHYLEGPYPREYHEFFAKDIGFIGRYVIQDGPDTTHFPEWDRYLVSHLIHQ